MTVVWAGVLFFASVMMVIVAIGYFYLQRQPETRRAVLSDPAAEAEFGMPHAQTVMVDLFRSIGENFPGAKNEKNPSRIRLIQAGYRWSSALPIFYGIKCGSALFIAGLLGTLSLLYRGEATAAFLPMICGAGMGFLLPDRVLASRVKARARRLRVALPPALDLMVLGMEAGQSLDQSIADASRGLMRTHPDLSNELAQLYLELRTSESRSSSYRNFSARNREPELRKLTSLLMDSDRFGASLAPALRSHAKYLRTRFRQHAQEAARKVGVKLIFPVFFLIFPSVLLVTLGPACIMMYNQLKNLLS